MTIATGYPPHELLPNQILLTKEEFYVLQAINSELNKTSLVIRRVRAKIKANGS